MKKTLFTLAALMCMTLGLTACGDDNDEPNDGVAVSATYEIEFSQDLLDVADISIVYYDNDGTANLDKPSSIRWTKKVTRPINKVPAQFGFKLVYKKKSSFAEKDSYELKATAKIKGETPSSNRTFEETMIDETVGANRIESTLNSNSQKAFGILLTKSGDISKIPGFGIVI